MKCPDCENNVEYIGGCPLCTYWGWSECEEI